MSQHEESNPIEMWSPLIGTIASAFALEKGPALLGIPADQIGIGLATVGFATALSTTGPLRQIAMSVAAHATVRELMRLFAAPPAPAAAPSEPPRRQADGGEYVTKSELMRMVGAFEANNQKMQATMLAEVRPLLDELRAERRAQVRPKCRAPAPAPSRREEADVQPLRPIDQAYALLSSDEQRQLIAQTSEMTLEQLTQLEAELSTMTVEEGAARLRGYLRPVAVEESVAETESAELSVRAALPAVVQQEAA